MEYIIGISVYLLSVYLMWRFTRIAHSKGGRWENITPNNIDIFAVFMPIFNTTLLPIVYLFFPPKKSKTDYNKFFKINK